MAAVAPIGKVYQAGTLSGNPVAVSAGIAMLRVAKSRALADARSYLEPDDIKAVAVAVLSHRLILAPEARSTGLTGEQIVRETLDKTPVPV